MPRIERPAMADYGVPADLDGVLPWEWARERLMANRNYWVVTASAGGRPHAMPVWGVWMGNDRFWFSCSANSRKLSNIAANPQTTIAVDDTVECVSVEGRARRVDPDDTGIEPMIAAYLVKYWPDPAVHQQMEAFLRSHAIVEFTPGRAFGIIEREDEFARRATRWVW
jgi:nitroimidazol reductase NimA-like FMN-containing flavoprotein (pyridoxamine 5'-phosphate oxidase superfamily)